MAGISSYNYTSAYERQKEIKERNDKLSSNWNVPRDEDMGRVWANVPTAQQKEIFNELRDRTIALYSAGNNGRLNAEGRIAFDAMMALGTGMNYEKAVRMHDLNIASLFGGANIDDKSVWEAMSESFLSYNLMKEKGKLGLQYAEAEKNGEDLSVLEKKLRSIDQQIFIRTDHTNRSGLAQNIIDGMPVVNQSLRQALPTIALLAGSALLTATGFGVPVGGILTAEAFRNFLLVSALIGGVEGAISGGLAGESPLGILGEAALGAGFGVLGGLVPGASGMGKWAKKGALAAVGAARAGSHALLQGADLKQTGLAAVTGGVAGFSLAGGIPNSNLGSGIMMTSAQASFASDMYLDIYGNNYIELGSVVGSNGERLSPQQKEIVASVMAVGESALEYFENPAGLLIGTAEAWTAKAMMSGAKKALLAWVVNASKEAIEEGVQEMWNILVENIALVLMSNEDVNWGQLGPAETVKEMIVKGLTATAESLLPMLLVGGAGGISSIVSSAYHDSKTPRGYAPIYTKELTNDQINKTAEYQKITPNSEWTYMGMVHHYSTSAKEDYSNIGKEDANGNKIKLDPIRVRVDQKTRYLVPINEKENSRAYYLFLQDLDAVAVEVIQTEKLARANFRRDAQTRAGYYDGENVYLPNRTIAEDYISELRSKGYDIAWAEDGLSFTLSRTGERNTTVYIDADRITRYRSARRDGSLDNISTNIEDLEIDKKPTTPSRDNIDISIELIRDNNKVTGAYDNNGNYVFAYKAQKDRYLKQAREQGLGIDVIGAIENAVVDKNLLNDYIRQSSETRLKEAQAIREKEIYNAANTFFRGSSMSNEDKQSAKVLADELLAKIGKNNKEISKGTARALALFYYSIDPAKRAKIEEKRKAWYEAKRANGETVDDSLSSMFLSESEDPMGTGLGENRGKTLLHSAQIVLGKNTDTSTIIHEMVHLIGHSVDGSLSDIVSSMQRLIHREPTKKALLDFFKENEDITKTKVEEVEELILSMPEDGNFDYNDPKMVRAEELIATMIEADFMSRANSKKDSPGIAKLDRGLRVLLARIADMIKVGYERLATFAGEPKAVLPAELRDVINTFFLSTDYKERTQGVTEVVSLPIPGEVYQSPNKTTSTVWRLEPNRRLLGIYTGLGNIYYGKGLFTAVSRRIADTYYFYSYNWKIEAEREYDIKNGTERFLGDADEYRLIEIERLIYTKKLLQRDIDHLKKYQEIANKPDIRLRLSQKQLTKEEEAVLSRNFMLVDFPTRYGDLLIDRGLGRATSKDLSSINILKTPYIMANKPFHNSTLPSSIKEALDHYDQLQDLIFKEIEDAKLLVAGRSGSRTSKIGIDTWERYKEILGLLEIEKYVPEVSPTTLNKYTVPLISRANYLDWDKKLGFDQVYKDKFLTILTNALLDKSEEGKKKYFEGKGHPLEYNPNDPGSLSMFTDMLSALGKSLKSEKDVVNVFEKAFSFWKTKIRGEQSWFSVNRTNNIAKYSSFIDLLNNGKYYEISDSIVAMLTPEKIHYNDWQEFPTRLGGRDNFVAILPNIIMRELGFSGHLVDPKSDEYDRLGVPKFEVNLYGGKDNLPILKKEEASLFQAEKTEKKRDRYKTEKVTKPWTGDESVLDIPIEDAVAFIKKGIYVPDVVLEKLKEDPSTSKEDVKIIEKEEEYRRSIRSNNDYKKAARGTDYITFERYLDDELGTTRTKTDWGPVKTSSGPTFDREDYGADYYESQIDSIAEEGIDVDDIGDTAYEMENYDSEGGYYEEEEDFSIEELEKLMGAHDGKVPEDVLMKFLGGTKNREARKGREEKRMKNMSRLHLFANYPSLTTINEEVRRFKTPEGMRELRRLIAEGEKEENFDREGLTEEELEALDYIHTLTDRSPEEDINKVIEEFKKNPKAFMVVYYTATGLQAPGLRYSLKAKEARYMLNTIVNETKDILKKRAPKKEDRETLDEVRARYSMTELDVDVLIENQPDIEDIAEEKPDLEKLGKNIEKIEKDAVKVEREENRKRIEVSGAKLDRLKTNIKNDGLTLQFALEANPSVTSGHLSKFLDKATDKMKYTFALDYAKAFDIPDILRKAGLTPVGEENLGVGVYIDHNGNKQISIGQQQGVKVDVDNNGVPTAEAQDKLNAVALAIGLIARQDSVAWGKALEGQFENEDALSAFAIKFVRNENSLAELAKQYRKSFINKYDLKNNLTKEEMISLGEYLKKETGREIGTVATKGGVFVVDFEAGDKVEFKEKAERAIDAWANDILKDKDEDFGYAHVGYFGNLVEVKYENDETWRQGISRLRVGRQVGRFLRDALAGDSVRSLRIGEVDKKYSEAPYKYGEIAEQVRPDEIIIDESLGDWEISRSLKPIETTENPTTQQDAVLGERSAEAGDIAEETLEATEQLIRTGSISREEQIKLLQGKYKDVEEALVFLADPAKALEQELIDLAMKTLGEAGQAELVRLYSKNGAGNRGWRDSEAFKKIEKRIEESIPWDDYILYTSYFSSKRASQGDFDMFGFPISKTPTEYILNKIAGDEWLRRKNEQFDREEREGKNNFASMVDAFAGDVLNTDKKTKKEKTSKKSLETIREKAKEAIENVVEKTAELQEELKEITSGENVAEKTSKAVSEASEPEEQKDIAETQTVSQDNNAVAEENTTAEETEVVSVTNNSVTESKGKENLADTEGNTESVKENEENVAEDTSVYDERIRELEEELEELKSKTREARTTATLARKKFDTLVNKNAHEKVEKQIKKKLTFRRNLESADIAPSIYWVYTLMHDERNLSHKRAFLGGKDVGEWYNGLLQSLASKDKSLDSIMDELGGFSMYLEDAEGNLEDSRPENLPSAVYEYKFSKENIPEALKKHLDGEAINEIGISTQWKGISLKTKEKIQNALEAAHADAKLAYKERKDVREARIARLANDIYTGILGNRNKDFEVTEEAREIWRKHNPEGHTELEGTDDDIRAFMRRNPTLFIEELDEKALSEIKRKTASLGQGVLTKIGFISTICRYIDGDKDGPLFDAVFNTLIEAFNNQETDVNRRTEEAKQMIDEAIGVSGSKQRKEIQSWLEDKYKIGTNDYAGEKTVDGYELWHAWIIAHQAKGFKLLYSPSKQGFSLETLATINPEATLKEILVEEAIRVDEANNPFESEGKSILYMESQEELDRVKNMILGKDNNSPLESIVRPELRQAGKGMMDLLKKEEDRVARASLEIDNMPMNIQENYFPLSARDKLSDALGSDMGAPAHIKNGFIMDRVTYADYEVDLGNPLIPFFSMIQKEEAYIHLSQAVKDINSVLGGKGGVSDLIKSQFIQGDKLVNALNDWIRDFAGRSSNNYDDLSKFINKSFQSIATGYLSFNIASAVKNLTSVIPAWFHGEISMLDWIKTVMDLSLNGGWDTWKERISEWSPIVYKGTGYLEVDNIRDISNLNPLENKRAKISAMGLWLFGQIEKFCRTSVFITEYNKEFAKTGNHQDAVNKATYLVTETQTHTSPFSQNRLQRDANKNVLMKVALVFSTNPNHRWNDLLNSFIDFKQGYKAEGIEKLIGFVVSATTIALISGGLIPDDDEGWVDGKGFAYEVFKTLVQYLIPVGGLFLEDVLGENGSSFFSAPKEIVSLIQAILKGNSSGKDLTRKGLRALADTASVFFPVPSNMAGKITNVFLSDDFINPGYLFNTNYGYGFKNVLGK